MIVMQIDSISVMLCIIQYTLKARGISSQLHILSETTTKTIHLEAVYFKRPFWGKLIVWHFPTLTLYSVSRLSFRPSLFSRATNSYSFRREKVQSLAVFKVQICDNRYSGAAGGEEQWPSGDTNEFRPTKSKDISGSSHVTRRDCKLIKRAHQRASFIAFGPSRAQLSGSSGVIPSTSLPLGVCGHFFAGGAFLGDKLIHAAVWEQSKSNMYPLQDPL